MSVPQSRLPFASCYGYSSSPSKSPLITQLKLPKQLPIVKYPLVDGTNFMIPATTLELSNLTQISVTDECVIDPGQEMFDDSLPPRKTSWKGRRGRPRVIRTHKVGGSVPSGALLHSPMPLSLSPHSSARHAFGFRIPGRKSAPSSPILSHPLSARHHKSSYQGVRHLQHQSQRRHFPSISTTTISKVSRHAHKRAKRSSTPSLHNNSNITPAGPTPIARRTPRTHKRLPSDLSRPSFPLTPLRFPPPPPSRPTAATPSSLHTALKQPSSLLPAMNLSLRDTLDPMLKKRSKRGLADLQWQITMHKSLAWRTTKAESVRNPRNNVMCDNCSMAAEATYSAGGMNFGAGGLRIAFGERPACTCFFDGGEREEGTAVIVKDVPQSHWTDSLDRELVKRLWVKLIARGCRLMPSSPPRPLDSEAPMPMLFPTAENYQPGIPFPSSHHSDPEQSLAPAIQLSHPTPCPNLESESHQNLGAEGITTPRRRLSSLAFTTTAPSKTLRTAVSVSRFPKVPVSSLQSRVNMDAVPSASSPASLPSFSATTFPSPTQQQPPCGAAAALPKGTLTPAQLAAQTIFRHGLAHSKPMRRTRPPGIPLQRASKLRHEVIME